jgi:hypothetical protein
MKETKEIIVASSHLPLSIIIIGLGTEDFENMRILDSDDKLLVDDDGNVAIRDIVQFVEFKEDMNDEDLKE